MKKYRKAFITVAFVGMGFLLGHESGKQTILDRWENRWFDSEWYDYRSIEDILKDQAYWER
tara:strand:- start:96 stop:278 length:183 start_codon:yes stop_codon:yes gene_type:complete